MWQTITLYYIVTHTVQKLKEMKTQISVSGMKKLDWSSLILMDILLRVIVILEHVQ